MKAIVYERYGPPDVLELRELEKPAVGDDDVLVRIRAASANPLDWHFLRGTPYVMRLVSGLLGPKSNRLGVDLAGEVETVGKNVTLFRPGDEVYGAADGAFAEYACAPAEALAPKPAKLSFEQAAAVPIAGWTALQFLRDKGRIRSGQKVLVNGASGGVGTFAVQIAKSFGAEVTGVCSTHNLELVRSIGADRVVDYTQEDFSRGDTSYDLVLDAVGNHSIFECRRVMKRDGAFLSVGGPDGRWLEPAVFMLKTSLSAPFVSQKVISHTARRSAEDLRFLNELFEAGKVTPVIDQTYSLSEVPEAIRYLEQGHARGKVVVSI